MYTAPYFGEGNYAVIRDGEILCVDCGLEAGIPREDFFPCELHESEHPEHCSGCHRELDFNVYQP